MAQFGGKALSGGARKEPAKVRSDRCMVTQFDSCEWLVAIDVDGEVSPVLGEEV